MGKSPLTQGLIDSLNECDQVGEIIVWDNSEAEEPLFYRGEKNRIIKSLTGNIYVNPAWNEMMSLVNTEFACICNDDLIFDTRIFKWLKPSNGCIYGMSFDNFKRTDFKPSLKTSESREYGWGCLMFLQTLDYIFIPEDLLIACGDDFLFQELTPMNICGLPVKTEMSTTSRYYGEIAANDFMTFLTKYKRND
jgi:hypothetical protein